MSERRAWSWGLALLLVTLGVSVLFFRFNAAPGEMSQDARRMSLLGDLITYYVPMAELAAGRVASGELPLWNPHVCSGIPLLATLQVGVFYPGNWLALVLPAQVAISWLMVIECLLAGWLAAWMFRAMGHDELACAAGGVLYVFGCVLGQTLWPPAASTLVFVPAILLALQKLCADPRGVLPLAWWAALVGTVALQLLAGFPQYMVYGLLLAGPFALLRLCQAVREGRASGREALRRGAMALTAGGLGVGLAAVQLLPTLELTRLGVRGDVMTLMDLHYLTLLAPHMAGDVVRAAFDPSPALVSFHLANSGGYLGVTTLLLAGIGVALAWRRGMTWLWLGLGVLTLVLSNGLFGWSAPLYRLFAELPVVGIFRTPERLRVVTFFCTVALAVSGFDAIRRLGAGPSTELSPGVPGGASRMRGATLGATVAGLATAIVGGMLWVGQGAGSWRVVLATALVLAVATPGAVLRLRQASAFLLFGLLLADLALATGEYGSLRGIPMADSGRFATPAGRRVPAGFFEEQRDALGAGRIELLRYRPRMATAPSSGGYRISCYEPMVPATWPALEQTLIGRSGRGATLFDHDPEDVATFYDVAGVRRVIRDGAGGPEVVANDDALPRAYVLADYRVATQGEAFEHLRDGDVDFRSVVLLEDDPGFPASEGSTLVAARIVEYAPERVVVEASSPVPGLLVLSDSHHPGWRATVDSRGTPILRANGLYRAVAVPAGRHDVVFEYDPPSLRWGAGVSLASLAVLSAVLLVGWRGGSRRDSRAGTKREG